MLFGAALITEKRVMEVEIAQNVKRFLLKATRINKLHNRKEKLVAKRDRCFISVR